MPILLLSPRSSHRCHILRGTDQALANQFRTGRGLASRFAELVT